MQLRNYQERAIANVEANWASGSKSVCLVGPTGSGKTYMGARLVGEKRTLWVAHRQELVTQAAEALTLIAGRANVGIVMPDYSPTPNARIQVGTIQTFLQRGVPADTELAIVDEVHHYVAPVFRELITTLPRAKLLGLTATPERADGTPLGDIQDTLVVAASYSELVASGDLVGVLDVWRPDRSLGNDLAKDPVDAWLAYGNGEKTFAFSSRLDGDIGARRLAKRFSHQGVPAECIEAETAKSYRADVVALFGSSRLRILTSVYTLTEGVNVPDASVALSGRGFEHASTMIQAFGRILRSAPGKERALIIDLCGVTNRLKMPILAGDPTYSLTGRAISGRDGPSTPPDREEHAPDVLGRDMVFVSSVATQMVAQAPTGTPPAPRVMIDMARVRRIRSRQGAAAADAELRRQERTGMPAILA